MLPPSPGAQPNRQNFLAQFLKSLMAGGAAGYRPSGGSAAPVGLPQLHEGDAPAGPMAQGTPAGNQNFPRYTQGTPTPGVGVGGPAAADPDFDLDVGRMIYSNAGPHGPVYQGTLQSGMMGDPNFHPPNAGADFASHVGESHAGESAVAHLLHALGKKKQKRRVPGVGIGGPQMP